MRPSSLVLVQALAGALLASACNNSTPAAVLLPPSGSFYNPSGIAFDDSQVDGGVLYVANANFDRRFSFGSVMAVPLASVGRDGQGLPPIGSVPAGAEVKRIYSLNVSAQVLTQNFAGEMRILPTTDGNGPVTRVFVPSRDVGSYLYVLEGRGTALTCPNEDTQTHDCSTAAPSLSANIKVGNGKPRAEEPYGVGLTPPYPVVDAQGVTHQQQDLLVTHLRQADDPVGSHLNFETYLVDVPNAGGPIDSLLEITDPTEFLRLGELASATNSVAVGNTYAFVSGRVNSSGGQTALLKLINWKERSAPLDPATQSEFLAYEARGLTIWEDTDPAHPHHTRVYLVVRVPETLLVMDVLNDDTATPSISVTRQIPLPVGASEVALIKRDELTPPLPPLVLITSSNNPAVDNVYSSTLQVAPNEGRFLVYDDAVGDLVAQIPQVTADANYVRLGTQPFGIAVQRDHAGPGARIFVGNLGDGRIAVIDMPDVARPQTIQHIAWLGYPHECIGFEGDPTYPSCVESP